MNYEKIIDLDNLTISDCERFYNNGKRIVVNDGKVVDIVEEEE